MKLGKWIIQLGLFLAVVFGLGSLVLPAHAATLPAGASAVNTQSTLYTTYPNADGKNAGTTFVGDTTLSLYNNPILAAPVAANNLSSNNRITNRTTKIYLLMSGKFSVLGNAGKSFKSINVELRNGSGTSTKVIATGANLISSQATSVVVSSNYYECDVNLSDLYTKLPLHIGFSITYSDGSVEHVTYATINEDADIERQWGGSDQLTNPKMYINGTTKSTQGGNVRYIKGSDKKITGVGYPGITLQMKLTKNGKVTTYNGVVNANGTFEFDLPDYIENLIDRKESASVGVSEYNEMGDHVNAVATVVQLLDIAAAKPSLSIDPDTLEDNIAGKSDSDILKWIAQQAGITVSYLGDQYNLNDVTLKSNQTDLATQIANLANGSSLTVKIGATNSANISTVDTADITLTRTEGALSFTSISPTLDFGSVAVPSQEMLFAPTTQPDISISDTQASGTPWYVMAQATDLTSTNGRKLAGHMVYVDADGEKESMANAVQVATGVRDRKTTYPQNTASKWSTTNQGLTDPATGLYIDALPTVYAGGNTMQYQGTVYWQLANAPGSVGSDISN